MSLKKKGYHHKNLRQALLVMTSRIIAEEGLDKLTLRELASRLGVSRTAPYRHFKDKPDLLAAVAEEKLQGLNQGLLAAFEAPTPMEQLRVMATAYLDFGVSHFDLYRLMFNDEFKNAEKFPNLAETWDETFSIMAQIVLSCRAAGYIKEADPNWLDYTAWSLLHGLIELYKEGKFVTVDNKDHFYTFAFESLMHGLKA